MCAHVWLYVCVHVLNWACMCRYVDVHVCVRAYVHICEWTAEACVCTQKHVPACGCFHLAFQAVCQLGIGVYLPLVV